MTDERAVMVLLRIKTNCQLMEDVRLKSIEAFTKLDHIRERLEVAKDARTGDDYRAWLFMNEIESILNK